MGINLLKPLQHTFASLGLRTVRCIFKLRTGSHIQFKSVVQFDIDGVQPSRNAPEFGNLIQIERGCCSHFYLLSREAVSSPIKDCKRFPRYASIFSLLSIDALKLS